jgi:hypothetical protein
MKKRMLFGILFIILLINFTASVRLPIVGGDSDEWGTVLNEFLNVSHNETGELKSDAILNFTSNLTLGQKITFALGEVIDNLADGIIQVTGRLDATGDIFSGGNNLSNAYFYATNGTYYLATNPFSFYNSTSFDINNYYLASNPFGFYNSTTLSEISGAVNSTAWNRSSTNVFLANTGDNVGIGTTSPGAKLDIYYDSTAYSGTAFNQPNLMLQASNTDGDYSGIGFHNTGGTREAFLGVVQTGAATGDLVYQTYTGSYGERFRITNAGNVGIGTASPLTKTEIYDASATPGVLKDVLTLTAYPSLAASENAASLLFRTRSNSPDNAVNISRIYAPLTDGTVGAWIGDLRFQTANAGVLADRMTIKGNGNVGIGTTTPQNTLNVVGDGNFTTNSYFGQNVTVTECIIFASGGKICSA